MSSNPPNEAPVRRSRGTRFLRFLSTATTRVILPLAVLAGGAYAAVRFIETAPKAERKPAVRQARLVEVLPVMTGPAQAVVQAMGSVRPARTVDLQPQVNGVITWVADHLEMGGHFRAGDTLLRIDPSDHELALRQRETDLARAESALRIEEGQQAIARREFEMLGESIGGGDAELVLRQPQLQSARATVDAARAAVQQARLNLERTNVVAPFNAVVLDRHADLGTQVGPSSRLVSLAGTDEFWVEVALPVDQLKWIDLPTDDGAVCSPVRVYCEAAWGPDVFRHGEVLRLASELEARGRMARLLIRVQDPLALEPESAGEPLLLIGTYVRVEIDGRGFDDVVTVNRDLVRNGDQVWIMDANGLLEFRPLEIVFRGPESVIVTGGLAPGERIVATEIAAPVEGMPLRTVSDEAPSPEPSPALADETRAVPAGGQRS